MEEFAITLVRGIGLGSVFSLVAMSLNIVYNSTDILNFAQGDWVVVGGLLAFLALEPGGGAIPWLLLIFAMGIAVAFGMATQGWLTLLPLKSSVEQHSWLVTTLAASAVITSLILIFQGPEPIVVGNPFGTFEFLGTRHPWLYPILLVLAVLTFLGLRWFHSRTLVGLTMHALRQDLDAARAAGAPVRRLQLLAFAISGLVVGVTGFVGSPVLSLSQSSGIDFALNGFVVAVVGGLGNQLGALIAGPVLGMLSVLAVFTVGGEFEQAVALLLLIAVLLVKPEGVFGRPAARRV
jgi:branched-chain amino acid transport system permease protein